MRLNWKLGVNLFVVLMLGVVTVGWVVSNILGNGIMNPPFEVVADFESTGGVFTNQEVTYRGVVVGKVGDLVLTEDGVDVSLLINEEWDEEIPADVQARVQNKSAVGEQFVNLTPLSETGGTLTDGSRIARANTEIPVDFQALLRSLDTVLADIPPEQVNRLITNLADGIGGRGEDIGTIISALSDLSVAFADAAPEQQRLLSNATRAGDAFLRTKDEFTAAMQASDDVLEGLGDEPEELAAFFRANDRLARRGSALLARHGDNLAAGIAGLADFVEFQNEEKASVIQSLEHVPEFLHAIEDASIPWESPDGRRFYRIRIGLVYDNVRSTWPCKYDLPTDYERYPHIRDARRPITHMRCREEGTEATEKLTRSLIRELRAYAREHRAELRLLTQRATSGFVAAFETSITAVVSGEATPEPTPTPTPTSTSTPTPASAEASPTP